MSFYENFNFTIKSFSLWSLWTIIYFNSNINSCATCFYLSSVTSCWCAIDLTFEFKFFVHRFLLQFFFNFTCNAVETICLIGVMKIVTRRKVQTIILSRASNESVPQNICSAESLAGQQIFRTYIFDIFVNTISFSASLTMR